MENQQKDWLATHLFYNGDWDKFLSEVLKPFAEEIINKKLAEKYFFIRYWEKGPHIRLRFYGKMQSLNEIVKPAIKNHFENYFKEKPSIREDNSDHKMMLLPNDSVQFITYEPEISRYGGPHTISLSEDQFYFSSKATLSVLEEGSDKWDYNLALGAAIQMHLGFAFALGMTKDETAAFYSRYFQNWLPKAYYSFAEKLTKEELNARRDEVLNAFETNYKEQKDTLVPYFSTIWDALESKMQFEQQWLNDWISNMQFVGFELKNLQKENKLLNPEWYTIHSKDSEGISKEERWSIYDSFVHMTNNRLGILNRDEGFLAYLIKLTTYEITDKTTA